MSQSKSSSRGAAAVFLAGILLSLGFALFTDQRWEDYYITYRVSRNLATGLGPVFQAGERVHAFTSPLGMLLPALFDRLTGSDEAALWCFRALSILAFAGAAALAWQATAAWGWATWSRLLAAGLILTDAKSVGFSINGMETGFVLLFLGLAIFALSRTGRRAALLLGFAWAGLLWTRPDGFVLFGAVAAGCSLFPGGQKIAPNRKALLRRHLEAAGVCALLYGPWVVWAWTYYGSPIPHTVTAKGLHHSFLAWKRFPPVETLLMPAYYPQFGGWPPVLAWAERLVAALALAGFFLPKIRPEVRVFSLSALFGCLYLWLSYPYPWYIPPVAFLAILAFAGLAETALKKAGPAWRAGAAAVAIAVSAALLLGSAWEMKWQQKLVEGERKAIGQWLAENKASPDDTVFLEPLGYIGYYSRLRMLDYPGLSSEAVVAARRKVGENWLDLIEILRPTWVLQRRGELQPRQPGQKERFLAAYVPVRIFDVGGQIAAVRFLPGRPFLTFDQSFLLYRRRP